MRRRGRRLPELHGRGSKVRRRDVCAVTRTPYRRPGVAKRIGHDVRPKAPVDEENDLVTLHAPCAAPT